MVIAEREYLPQAADRRKQKQIYSSIDRMSIYYGIQAADTRKLSFPYNVALAMWDLENKLNGFAENWQRLHLLKKKNNTLLASEERYNTGGGLYHIPVLPLFRMLHDRNRCKAAQLLLSVCCYLYRIADIPYYSQEDSFLYYQYDMLSHWFDEDEQEEQEAEESKREINTAEWVGEHMQPKLKNGNNLLFFRRRLEAFKAKDTFAHDCLRVAAEALALYEEYPKESIFRNKPFIENENREYDYKEQYPLPMEYYISFVADTHGWLYQCLFDNLNCEFGEYYSTEEPTIYRFFDERNGTGGNFDFEKRLFTLIEDLTSLLHNY